SGRRQVYLDGDRPVTVVVRPLAASNDRAGDVVIGVSLILAVPLVVLAIGCANAANLQLSRAACRLDEIAVRLSLGASRARLVRQLLIESCLVSLAAGIGGLALAVVVGHLLASLMPVPAPIDWRVLSFTIAIAAVTGIGFGIAPALAATRGDLTTPLKDSAA